MLVLYIASSRKCADNLTAWEGTWEDLCNLYRCHCFKLPVTRAQFIALPDKKRAAMKDVGGVVPAVLADGRRSNSTVIGRDFVSIDVDHAPVGFLDSFKDCFRWDAIIHTTASSTLEFPRYRVLIPLMERISGEEYKRVALRVIKMLGLSIGDDAMTDDVSLVPAQLMYWPACCKDEEVTLIIQDTGGFLSVHELPVESEVVPDSADQSLSSAESIVNFVPSPVVESVRESVPYAVDYKAEIYASLHRILACGPISKPLITDPDLKQQTISYPDENQACLDAFFSGLKKCLEKND